MAEGKQHQLECVEPSVGERILELEGPALGAEERELLMAHAEVCALCRMTLDLHRELGQGMRDGRLRSTPRRASRLRLVRRLSTAGAGLAVAASLASLLVLPPRPVGPELLVRGPGETRVVRPVEGEVISPGRIRVEWTDVQGADAYRLRLSKVGGDDFWTTTTDQTEVEWIAGEELVEGEGYRLLLSTEPPDLMPSGGVSVHFRVAGAASVALYRLKQAQPVTQALALAAILLVLIATTARKWIARPRTA